MKKLIYIASPYTNGEQELNVLRQIHAAEYLTKHGFVPFVPLLSHYWNMIYTHEYEFWMELCLCHLSKCDGLLRLHGQSIGADTEVEFANTIACIPVFYSFLEIKEYFNKE